MNKEDECEKLIKIMRKCVNINKGTMRCRSEIENWEKMCKNKNLTKD